VSSKATSGQVKESGAMETVVRTGFRKPGAGYQLAGSARAQPPSAPGVIPHCGVHHHSLARAGRA
jgi:hypothetical protein